MPTISTFRGIAIRMYYEDHSPPHFHALYQGREAKVRIDPPSVIEGELPSRIARSVLAWAERIDPGCSRTARARSGMD